MSVFSGLNSSSVLAALGGGGGGSGGGSSSTSETRVMPELMQIYNQTLGLNQKNYQNVLDAFGKGSAGLESTLPDIYKGYGDLRRNVAETLGYGGKPWGVASDAANRISEDFTRQQGATQQQIIDRGLGNTTVLQNLSNQNTLMAGRAFGNLGAELAKLYANYDSQLGQAELQSRMQGAQAQAQFQQGTGSTLAGYRFGNTVGGLTGGFSQSTSTGAPRTPQASYAGAGPIGGRLGGGGRSGGRSDFLPMEQGGGGYGWSGFTPASGTLDASFTAGRSGGTYDFSGGGGGGANAEPFVSSVGSPMSGFQYQPSGGIQDPYDLDLRGLDLTGGGMGDQMA